MNDRVKAGVPTEVEEMAEAFIRTCAKHRVCFTGFMFREGTETNKPFVTHLGTVTNTGESLRSLHLMLLEFVERANPPRTVLKKNDA